MNTEQDTHVEGNDTEMSVAVQIEHCRFCQLPGIAPVDEEAEKRKNRKSYNPNEDAKNLMLFSKEHQNKVEQGKPDLIMPCECNQRLEKFAHTYCLISWIQSKLEDRCPNCDIQYKCVHKDVPLNKWRTDPTTDMLMNHYYIAVGLLLFFTILTCYMCYIILKVNLPLPFRILAALIVIAMFGAVARATFERCVDLYHILYLFNCKVTQVKCKSETPIALSESKV